VLDRQFNSIKRLWTPAPPEYTRGHSFFRLEQGHDILLQGEAPLTSVDTAAKRFAVRPADYRGLSPIPKVTVQVGDEVKAGDVIFFDKKNPVVKFVAPVGNLIHQASTKQAEKTSSLSYASLEDGHC